MQLYLMRHGTAVELGQHGVSSDAERMLSPEGVEKTKAVARGFKRTIEPLPQRVLSSPLLRARQTAEIVAAAAAPGVDIEYADELRPGADTADTLAWLARQPQRPTLLVGHLPDLDTLASRLVSGTDRVRFLFKKAAVLGIEFERGAAPGRGVVTFLLQPAVLRRLGE